MILGAFYPLGSRYRPRNCHCCFPGIRLVSPICSASLLLMINIVLEFQKMVVGRCFRHCQSSTQSGTGFACLPISISPSRVVSSPCFPFCGIRSPMVVLANIGAADVALKLHICHSTDQRGTSLVCFVQPAGKTFLEFKLSRRHHQTNESGGTIILQENTIIQLR